MYEWMTHNSCHEVTSTVFCDWIEVNVEEKRKTLYFSTTGWSKVHLSFQLRAGGGGWICIHGVGPWENVSLGCIVSHLENHLPTSPCSCSLSPPLAHPIHSHTNTHARTQGTLHSQTSFILSNCANAQQLYTQTHNPQCKCKMYCNLSIKD